MAIDNMHKKFGKDRACGSGDILIDRQTHTHTRTHQYSATSPTAATATTKCFWEFITVSYHCGYLLVFGKSAVLLRQILGQLCDAHVRMLLRVTHPLAHKKTEIRSQRFLRQLWVFYLQHKYKSIQNTEKMTSKKNSICRFL